MISPSPTLSKSTTLPISHLARLLIIGTGLLFVLTISALRVQSQDEQPSATLPIPAEPPFDCGLLSVNNLRIHDNQVLFDIGNANGKPSVITRIILGWNTIGTFPNMRLYEIVANGVLLWRGQDYNPPTHTNFDPSNPANYFQDTAPEDRTVAEGDSSTITGKFTNAPSYLLRYLTITILVVQRFTWKIPTTSRPV